MIRDSFHPQTISKALVRKHLDIKTERDIETPYNRDFADLLPKSIFKSFDGCAVQNEFGFREAIESSARGKGFITAKYEAYSFSFPVFNANFDRALVVVTHQGLKSQWLGGKWSDFEIQSEQTLLVLQKQSGAWTEVAREEI